MGWSASTVGTKQVMTLLAEFSRKVERLRYSRRYVPKGGDISGVRENDRVQRAAKSDF